MLHLPLASSWGGHHCPGHRHRPRKPKGCGRSVQNLSAGAVEISYSSSSTGYRGGFGGGMMMGGGGNRGGGGFGGEAACLVEAASACRPTSAPVELDEEDLEDILLFCHGIASGTISATGSATVMGGDLEESTTATVAAVKTRICRMWSNLSLAIGDFITEEDDENVSKVAVIGYDLAVEIFGSPWRFLTTPSSSTTATTLWPASQEMAPHLRRRPDSAYSSRLPPALNACWGGVSAPPSPWLPEDVNDVEEIVTNVLSSTRATPGDQFHPSATLAARWGGHRLHQDDDPAAAYQTSIVFVVVATAL